MTKRANQLIYFIISLFAFILLLFAKFKWQLSFNVHVSIIIVISVITVLIVGFIIYAALKSAKDPAYPLGLPNGSIRAIVSLLVLLFFVLLSLSFYNQSHDNEIAKDILKTLGTLLIAVSGFYFGSKATEQGSKIATDAFNKTQETLNAGTGSVEDVPMDVIEEAIGKNKEEWKNTYKCIDIIAGQKQTGNTTNNINCIVFIVETKGKRAAGAEAIPTSISYGSRNKVFAIPTDVQEKNATNEATDDMPNEEQPTNQTGTTNSTSQDQTSQEVPVDIDIKKKAED